MNHASALATDGSLNDGMANPDGLIYDYRPDLENLTNPRVLKPWILPSGNEFIKNPNNKHERPLEDLDIDVPYAQSSFDDDKWESVTLPHDWAIAGPFVTQPDYQYAGMGRLPSQGVGWYRRTIDLPSVEKTQSYSLEFDGAMSYAMV
jgi:beta-galactosidase